MSPRHRILFASVRAQQWEVLMQACRCKITLVTRTIGAERGRAARGRPGRVSI